MDDGYEYPEEPEYTEVEESEGECEPPEDPEELKEWTAEYEGHK